MASWLDRLIAGAIDCGLVSVTVGVPLYLSRSYMQADPHWSIPTLVLFTYYVVMEYKSGQTIGKRLMNIKTANIYGSKISLKESLLNSFGKVFLLPVDFVVGLAVSRKKRQRLFNKLSDTIVVKLEKTKQ